MKTNNLYKTYLYDLSRLHIYDTDNRVTGVLEYADPVTTNGSMDYTGTTGSVMAVEYNEWGISRH